MLPPNLRSPPKLLVLALLAATLIILPTLYLLSDSLEQRFDHDRLWALGSVRPLPSQLETGGTIMGALTNETIKAEVGRASWKLLHTMAGRFPDRPTEEERETYRSFLHLFSRLYPCGDCATHFQQLLKDFPPQTSSRKVVSMYMCFLHNQVNQRLGKDEFDCTTLDGLYDCGCGPEKGPTDAITGLELIGG